MLHRFAKLVVAATVLLILTGSLVLLADLIRQLEMPLRVALIQASRLRTPDEPRQATTNALTEAMTTNARRVRLRMQSPTRNWASEWRAVGYCE